MGVFARLFPCLLIRVSLWILGRLVVCVYVCLCVFRHLAARSLALSALWESFLCFSWTLGGPGTPLLHLGLHFSIFGGSFCMFLVLGGALGPSLLIFELRLGVLGVHFRVF